MAKPLTLSMTVPAHITPKAEVDQRGGIYFGTNWTFTTVDEIGEMMMIRAISDMLADYSVEQIGDAIRAFRASPPLDLPPTRG